MSARSDVSYATPVQRNAGCVLPAVQLCRSERDFIAGRGIDLD